MTRRLTDLGYVRRTIDTADRRRRLFATLPDGEALVERTLAQRKAWLREQFAMLCQTEQKTFLSYLRKISAAQPAGTTAHG